MCGVGGGGGWGGEGDFGTVCNFERLKLLKISTKKVNPFAIPSVKPKKSFFSPTKCLQPHDHALVLRSPSGKQGAMKYPSSSMFNGVGVLVYTALTAVGKTVFWD